MKILGTKMDFCQLKIAFRQKLPSLIFSSSFPRFFFLVFWRSLPLQLSSSSFRQDQLTTSRSPHLHLLASSAPSSSSSLGCSSSRSSKQQQQGQQLQRWSRATTVLDVRPIFRRQFRPILDSLESSLRVLHFFNLNRFDLCLDRPEIKVEVR